MKRKFLVMLALAACAASAVPVVAQQQRSRSNVLPTALDAPAAPTAPTAPAAPDPARVFARFQTEALAASRGIGGKIAVRQFADEYVKAAKAADADSDGVLSADELRQAGGGDDRPGAFGGFGGFGAPGAPETGMSKAIASAAGADGAYSLAKLEEALTEALQRADADSDGSLDETESRALLGFGADARGRSPLQTAASAFRRQAATAAATEDGRLEIAKFRAEILSLFQAGDENGDGVLNADERQKLDEKAREAFGGFGARNGADGTRNGADGDRNDGPGRARGPFDAMKTEDGKIDLSKLPERFPDEMKSVFKDADADGDGFLDADEEKALQEKMREQFQRGPNGGPNDADANGERRGRRGENGAPTRTEDADARSNARPRRGSNGGPAGALGDGPGMNGVPGGFPGGGPGMNGVPGGFPGGMGGGFNRGSDVVVKALAKAAQENGDVVLATFDQELGKALADADAEDDGFLDATEQEDAFGVPIGAPGAPGDGPNAFGGPRGERPNGVREPRDENRENAPNDANAPGGERAPRDARRGDRENGRPTGANGRPGFGGGANFVFVPTPDDAFVGVPKSESFRFGKSSTGTGAGEKSPLENDFAIGRYEVRNREYKEFVDATNRQETPKYWVDGTFVKGTKNCPVVGVTLKDAQDYCEWLATKYDGWTFRLPTEAEFERAALGDQKRYPWGNTAETSYKKGVLTTNFQYNGAVIADLIAADATAIVDGKELKVAEIAKLNATGAVSEDGWRDAKTKSGFTYSTTFSAKSKEGGYVVPVNKFRANRSQFGVVGAAGNAAEWTSSVVDGKNVVRGGSWYSSAEECASTYRGETKDPTKADPTIGFRVVAEPRR